VTYESWIKKALQQAGALHPGFAEQSAQGAIYFVGCTINIVTGAHGAAELPEAACAIDAEPSAMATAVRPMKVPGTQRAE
jgi:hypothetical protein